MRRDDGKKFTGKRQKSNGCLEPGSSVSRRDFLRLGSAATLGLATGSLWIPQTLRASTNETSRVVIVTDAAASSGEDIQPDIVRIMVDAGVKALTDAATPQEAWLTLFPELTADLSVGIKISTINDELSSHPEVAYPIAESLAATSLGGSTYPENNIVIWDRWGYELEDAGYTINTSSSGVRCIATDQPGYGYTPETITVNGSSQHVSRLYTEYSDNLINLCLIKNHTFSGVTHSLKNHYGTIDNPEGLHVNYCRYYVPALNSALIDTYGEIQKLCICDAIFGIYYNGPMGPPQFVYNSILLAQDPVALDAICRNILDVEYNCNTIWMSNHIDIAAQEPYNLGIADLQDIELVEIVNPSGILTDPNAAQPDGIALGKNYPEPFNAETNIPFTLDRHADVELAIYDVKGRKLKSLYAGTLSAGTHRIAWSGEDRTGRPAASGRYIVRMKTARKIHSRSITLLR